MKSNIIKVDCRWWVLDIINNPQITEFAVTAGLGAGKTHGACQVHHIFSCINQLSRFSAFYEPVYHLIHKAAIPTYIEVLNQFGLVRDVHFKVLKSPYPKIIYLQSPSQHEVIFQSAENPMNIAGYESSHSTTDEQGTCHPDAQDRIQDRVRCPMAKRLISGSYGVPENLNHYSERYDSDTLPDWIQLTNQIHEKVSGVRTLRRYKFSTLDNPYLSDVKKQEMMDRYKHNPQKIKSYIYGEFCNLSEGLAVPNYKPVVHDIEYLEVDPFNTLDLSFDFNNSPVSWVVASKCEFDAGNSKTVKRWVIHDSAEEDNNQLIDAIIEFAEKYPPSKYQNTKIRLFGDRSGHKSNYRDKGTDYEFIHTSLKKLGYKNVIIEAQKQVILEEDSLNVLDRLFFYNYIFITDRCKTLKRSLNRTMLKKGLRKIDKPTSDDWTHFVDALKYWAFQVTKDFNPENSRIITGINKGY